MEIVSQLETADVIFLEERSEIRLLFAGYSY